MGPTEGRQVVDGSVGAARAVEDTVTFFRRVVEASVVAPTAVATDGAAASPPAPP